MFIYAVCVCRWSPSPTHTHTPPNPPPSWAAWKSTVHLSGRRMYSACVRAYACVLCAEKLPVRWRGRGAEVIEGGEEEEGGVMGRTGCLSSCLPGRACALCHALEGVRREGEAEEAVEGYTLTKYVCGYVLWVARGGPGGTRRRRAGRSGMHAGSPPTSCFLGLAGETRARQTQRPRVGFKQRLISRGERPRRAECVQQRCRGTKLGDWASNCLHVGLASDPPG